MGILDDIFGKKKLPDLPESYGDPLDDERIKQKLKEGGSGELKPSVDGVTPKISQEKIEAIEKRRKLEVEKFSKHVKDDVENLGRIGSIGKYSGKNPFENLD